MLCSPYDHLHAKASIFRVLVKTRKVDRDCWRNVFLLNGCWRKLQFIAMISQNFEKACLSSYVYLFGFEPTPYTWQLDLDRQKIELPGTACKLYVFAFPKKMQSISLSCSNRDKFSINFKLLFKDQLLRSVYCQKDKLAL